MQTRRRRNFLVGGVAALTLATGVAFGGQAAWNDAYASTQPTALVAAAPVTAEQQDVAGIAPSQETLAKLYDELSPSVVNIQVTINTPQQDLSQRFPFPFPLPGPLLSLPPPVGSNTGIAPQSALPTVMLSDDPSIRLTL